MGTSGAQREPSPGEQLFLTLDTRVTCPQCQAKVEMPTEAVGPDRTDLWNLAHCECGNAFDYDDDAVIEKPDGE